MTKVGVRWILAFDAACGTCQEIADTVAKTCTNKLEVMPLKHPDVRDWRERAMGAQAPWQPTLIRVNQDDVAAWTGRRLVPPLVRRLGVRSTMRLLRALGDLRVGQQNASSGMIGRQQVLRFGAGLAVAGGLVLTSKTAAAAPQAANEVQDWVRENLDRLPDTYTDLVKYPVDYRKAIYLTHSPQVRSALWTAHIEQYRADHPKLTQSQHAVVDKALELVSNTDLFARGYHSAQDNPQALDNLTEAAIAELGRDEARALIANLGTDTTAAAIPDCQCSTQSDWCGPWTCLYAYCYTSYARCRCSEDGCGSLWQYSCNGRCNY